MGYNKTYNILKLMKAQEIRSMIEEEPMIWERSNLNIFQFLLET